MLDCGSRGCTGCAGPLICAGASLVVVFTGVNVLPNKDFGNVVDVVGASAAGACFLLGDVSIESGSCVAADVNMFELCVVDPALNILAKLLVAGCVSCDMLGDCRPRVEDGVAVCDGCAEPPAANMFGVPCVTSLRACSVGVEVGAPNSDDVGGPPADAGVFRCAKRLLGVAASVDAVEKSPPPEFVDVEGAENVNVGGIESDFVGEGDLDGSGSFVSPGVPKENRAFLDLDESSADPDAGLKLNPANGLGACSGSSAGSIDCAGVSAADTLPNRLPPGVAGASVGLLPKPVNEPNVPKLDEDCCDVGLSSSCGFGVDVSPKRKRGVLLGALEGASVVEVKLPNRLEGFDTGCAGESVTLV